MSAPPYMKLYVADYLGDTHHLGALEHGAYLLLLMGMWRAGGSLPAADANLCRLARCTPSEWDQVKGVILPFFVRSRGKLTHRRLTAEMAKYESTSGKRSEAGKRGVAEKSKKNNGEAQAIAFEIEGNCTHNQNHNHIDNNPPTPQEGGQGESLFGDKPDEPEGRRRPKVKLPAGLPTAEQVSEAQAKARAAGANVDMAYQAERFRNWAESKDARYADWGRTWANWALKSIQDAPKVAIIGAAKPAATQEDRNAWWDRRVAEFRKSRHWNEVDWGPRPGRDGCTVPAEILAKHGYSAKPEGEAA